MSKPLAFVLLAALTYASVCLWLDHAIRRAYRNLRVGCGGGCPCGAS